MPRGGKPKIYEASLVEKVRVLYYERGMTQVEVAAATGLTQKIIWKLMLRHGLWTRPRVKRDQRGSRNGSWKGDEARYAAMHRRVEALYGRPLRCEECGTTDPSRRYDWANLTGRYADPSDYRRLCRSCHCKFDNQVRKLPPPKLTAEQVESIRARRAAGEFLKSIAADFPVTMSRVHQLTRDIRPGEGVP